MSVDINAAAAAAADLGYRSIAEATSSSNYLLKRSLACSPLRLASRAARSPPSYCWPDQPQGSMLTAKIGTAASWSATLPCRCSRVPAFDQANSAAVKIVSAHWREIAGKELEPQSSGNVREANSHGRKEAMGAVV